MWDAFAAFGGQMTSSFVKPSPDTHSGFNYVDTRTWIHNWFHGLRTSPINYGIPKELANDVVKLLNVFFPESTEQRRIIVNRINFANMRSRIDPIMVRFYKQATPVAVADAPNALAYIFTVATPPINLPTFENYYLPLAVCYSWTLYVLFLWPTPGDETSIGNVPADVCLLYRTGDNPKFCLGSTWSGANPADAVASGAIEAAESELERWRENHTIEPLLMANQIYPAPPINPTRYRLAARRLNEYILGQLDYDKRATPFLAPLFTGVFDGVPGMPAKVGLPQYHQVVGNMMKAESAQPLATILEPNFLISHAELGPKLMDGLSALLDALVFSDDPSKLLTSFTKVVGFYVTPHVIDPLTKKELPLGQYSKPIVEGLAMSLPLLLLESIKGKGESLRCHLERIHVSTNNKIKEAEQRYFIYEVKPYSHSAEACPLYVLYTLWKSVMPSSDGGKRLQGFNLRPRIIGQAILDGMFSSSFSASNLDGESFSVIQGQSTSEPIAAGPDSEGRILLQVTQNMSNDSFDSYYEGVKGALPRTFELLSRAQI